MQVKADFVLYFKYLETSFRFVTKLVPRLEEVEQCTDVPQEVCTKNRGAPRKVKQPVVKKWCYHVKQETSSTGTGASYGRNF